MLLAIYNSVHPLNTDISLYTMIYLYSRLSVVSLKSASSSSSMSSLESWMEGHILVHHRHHLPCYPNCLKFITSWNHIQYFPWKCYPTLSEPIHTAIHFSFFLFYPACMNECCVEHNHYIAFSSCLWVAYWWHLAIAVTMSYCQE